MNKCMLVGAVGLALAGVAVASDDGVGLSRSLRVDASSFTQMRNAALGDAGSTHRAEILAQLRSEIAAGNIDPRTVVFIINEDLIPGSGRASNLTGGNNTTEGALGANAQFFDDSSTYQLTSFLDPPSSLISINGQSNPAGFVFGGQDWTGAATDAVMTNVGPNNPPGGGMAPLTQPAGGEPYIALARLTGLDAENPNFNLNFNQRHQLFTPQPGADLGHMRLSTDWYLTDAGTSQWWSPVSFVEGFVMDRMFFGGTELGGVLGFGEDANGILTNFVSLGVLAGNFTIGQFYAPPRDASVFPFPENEWFSMMAVLAQNSGGGIGYGMFIKTPQTIANGVLDPRLASGDIIATDKDPAGWLNTYPGIDDDAGTMGQIEGIGLGATQFGELAPTNGAFGLATILAAVSASGTQFGQGLDPAAGSVPGFVPADAFIDNYIAKGIEFQRPCPLPDFIIPYKDDMEFYTAGAPIRLQTDRYFDGLSSNSVISTTQNTTNPGSQSLAQQNVNNDNLFRDEFNTDLPVFPAKVIATSGAPLVATVQVRMASSTRTGRAVRLLDGGENGNFVGTVLLGATDPTAAFLQADGKVWVRQPNVGSNGIWGTPPGFDENEDAENNLSQGNWRPESTWAFPPMSNGNPVTFNTQFINVPTGASADGSDGVTVSPGSFNLIRMEATPNANQDPNNPFDEGILRVFINGAEVFPNGDSSQQWLAGGFSGSNIQFWSSNNTTGQFDVQHVDDICFDGPIFVRNPGPAFSLPYDDGFEAYDLDVTIDGQGDTPFLSTASVPDAPANDSSRKLTLLDTNSNVPVDGTLVCRYMVDEVKLNSGLFAVGDVVALNFDALPLPFNTFLDTNTDCPGSGPTDDGMGGQLPGTSTAFIVRPAENAPRVEEGFWTLQNLANAPEPFDSTAGDNTGLSISFTTIARWFVPGVDNVAIVRNEPTMPGAGTAPNVVLGLISTFGVDGSTNNNPIFGMLGSTLPEAQSTAPMFPNAGADVVMSWDLYIESVDVDNNPASPLQAPRSRMEVSIFGATGNAGHITDIMYGGPNVNNHSALQGLVPPVAIIPDDEISYAIAQPDGLTDPAFQFQAFDNPVSLISGGGGVTGPLLNSWFRTILTLHADGTFDIDIDEDRDGALPPVRVLTAGTAIDLGNIGTGGAIVNTSGIDSFNINAGFDIGSGGEPIVQPFRIHTFNGPSGSNWDAVGPSNAAQKDDYCFYETNLTEFEDMTNQAQIADVTADTAGDVTGQRPLDQNNDVIAVINRAFDHTAGTVSGPLIHDPCPVNITNPVNKFSLSDSAGNVVYEGRWGLDDQVGQSGVNNPSPAGGISRPDGPSLPMPVSYNDPLAEPPGFPATIAARPIILAEWGSDDMDANQGVDPTPAVLPRSRWFVDNVHLDQLGGGAACADIAGDPTVVDGADLATLLVNFGAAGGPADLNGDGIVDGADLAILLVNFGPCP